MLKLLVERYEHERYSIPAADPISVVRFLVDQQNLAQRDLIPEFGSENAVSMFLSGQRQLTLEQVRKLSARFKLPLICLWARDPKQLAGVVAPERAGGLLHEVTYYSASQTCCHASNSLGLI